MFCCYSNTVQVGCFSCKYFQQCYGSEVIYNEKEFDRIFRSIDVKGLHIDIDLRGSVEEVKKDD